MGKSWWNLGEDFSTCQESTKNFGANFGANFEQISERISETSFQISRLFSETSFSRRAALANISRIFRATCVTFTKLVRGPLRSYMRMSQHVDPGTPRVALRMASSQKFGEGGIRKGVSAQNCPKIIFWSATNLRQFRAPFSWCAERNARNFALIWRAICDNFSDFTWFSLGA